MKILKSLLEIFSLSKKADKLSDDVLEKQRITVDFKGTDRIARIIFSPFIFKNNRQNLIQYRKETLNKNTFEIPPDRDELSVNRLDYTTSNHLKKLGKFIDIQSDENRNYCGIAIINVSEIWSSDATIEYSPLYINGSTIFCVERKKILFLMSADGRYDSRCHPELVEGQTHVQCFDRLSMTSLLSC
jgi:hypothetical protein